MNFVPLLTAVLAAAGITGGTYVKPVAPIQHHAYVSGAVGMFDTFDNAEQDSAADFRAEYRFKQSIYSAGIVSIHPFVGGEVTSDGALYGLGGLQAQLMYGDFYLTPSFGAGYYDSGSGKEMGAGIQFRTQIETGYQFSDKGNRLGVALSHISNAEIGDKNPGAEIITLYYHLPLY